MGLRVLVGRRQAVVSTNDMSGDGVAALAERAVAMAQGRARGQVCRASPIRRCWPKASPISTCSTANCPMFRRLRRLLGAPKRLVALFSGVSKSGGASAAAGIGGMVLLTSHGFSGAYLGSRHSISMQAIAGEGTGMETDYDFSSALHATDLDAPEKIGTQRRREGGGQAQPAQGLDHEGPGDLRHPHRGLDRRPSGQRHQRRVDRAQDELPQGQDRRAASSRPASTSSTIRCASAACARGRSTPRASPAGAWR